MFKLYKWNVLLLLYKEDIKERTFSYKCLIIDYAIALVCSIKKIYIKSITINIKNRKEFSIRDFILIKYKTKIKNYYNSNYINTIKEKLN